jgi:hypothetical protein
LSPTKSIISTEMFNTASKVKKGLEYEILGELSSLSSKNLVDVVLVGIVVALVLLCIFQAIFSSLTVYMYCKGRNRVHASGERADGMQLKATPPCFTTRSLQDAEFMGAHVKVPRFVPRPSLAFLSQRDHPSTSSQI